MYAYVFCYCQYSPLVCVYVCVCVCVCVYVCVEPQVNTCTYVFALVPLYATSFIACVLMYMVHKCTYIRTHIFS